MTHEGAGNAFQFINTTDGHRPRDAYTRQIIRKQAMAQTAAARRSKGRYGKTNVGQFPPSTEEQHQYSFSAHASNPNATECTSKTSNFKDVKIKDRSQGLISDREVKRSSARSLPNWGIPVSLSGISYECMRIQHDFDLLDISALASMHTGRVTAHILSREPSRLADILRCRQWSYFSFLPSRLGHTTCLDDAAHCVAAKVRHRLSSPFCPPNPSIISLYSRALASLQTALNDPKRFLQPDVLCATELLAVYELLDTEGDQAWVRHIAGAATLIKARGPGNYKTEFEKALFLGSAGPIFTEALLKGTSCFLEEDAWQEVFRSIINDSSPFSDRSDSTITLWATIVHVPRLFAETEDAVYHSNGVGCRVIERLTHRLYHIRESVVDWRKGYESVLYEHCYPPSEQARYDMRYEILGVGLGILIVLNRLILALNYGTAGELEIESQTLATQIVELERQIYSVNPRATVFIAFKKIVANATIETRGEWRSGKKSNNNEQDKVTCIIPEDIFKHWCSLKGRETAKFTRILKAVEKDDGP